MSTKTEVNTVEEPQGERTVRIMLPYDSSEGDMFVSVNERTFLIKRGVEVEVPECVAEVIRERERRIMSAYASAEQYRS